MDDKDKLTAHWLQIKQQLKVRDVLDYLVEKEAIGMNDKREILSSHIDEEQCDKLLKILRQRLTMGHKILPIFINALGVASYHDLKKSLESNVTPELPMDQVGKDVRGEMSVGHRKSIENSITKIARHLDAKDITDHFVQAGYLNEKEEQTILRCDPPTREKRTEIFLFILFTLNDKAYDTFLKALINTGYKELVDDIKAYQDPRASISEGGARVQDIVEPMRRMNVGDISGGAAGGMPTPRRTHVMISYCHQNRGIVKQVHGELQRRGFDLWVDWKGMPAESKLNEAMAKAVENSYVFLMCFSRAYHKSQNCTSEAEYARERKIPILSLRMEAGYNPDGWLGIVNAGNLWVDFSSPDLVRTNIETLAAKILKIKRESEV